MMHNIRKGLTSDVLFNAGFYTPWAIRNNTPEHKAVTDWFATSNLGQWLLFNNVKTSINIILEDPGPVEDWPEDVSPLYVDFVLSDMEYILYCLIRFI